MATMPWRRLQPAGIIAFLLLAGLCGCAAAPVAAAEAKSLAEGPVSHGVVVAVRPMTEAPGAVRGRILGAVGVVAAERVGVASPAPREAVVEIIVRQDDGRAISVMQANTDGIRAGERVLLTRGAGTRVARPGA